MMRNKEQRLPPLPDTPLVSVIASNLNHGRYLEETIRSVLTQDYPALELIVIDGASTDHSLDVLRRYANDPRVRWISEADSGHMAAINKGLRLAAGQIIGVCHSSDGYQPGAIREAVQAFLADPLLAFVGGAVQVIDVESRPTGEIWRVPDDKPVITLEEALSFTCYPGIQASFLRRDLARAIGGFHDDPSCHTNTFLHYFVEASARGMQARRVPKMWGTYRDHPDHGEGYRSVGKGLGPARKRVLTCRQMARQYHGYLTRAQVRLLLRSGYEWELQWRVMKYFQIIQAIPVFVLYLWFGGRLPSRKDVRDGIDKVGFAVKRKWSAVWHHTALGARRS